MFLSLVMFGFLGGISGVVLGTEQINLIMHNTLYVPGHFHATVVTGTTLAFMAVTYLVIPLIFQRHLVLPRIARWQPYVFGIGAAGISLFMMGAGTLGVSRRHWDITFSEALFSFDYPATAFLMMGLNGIAALLAATGGIMYVVVVVGSILFGQKTTAGLAQGVEADRAVRPGGCGHLRQRGHLAPARHLRAGGDLLHGVRALLLRQLEVPVRNLADGLRRWRRILQCCAPKL